MRRINRVYLIRHGQINGYENFPFYGHTEVDLTEIGILQMQQVAERLRFAEIGAIYSSDLERSASGARMIARYHDVPLRFLSELKEIYFGDWEGRTMAEIRSDFPKELAKRQADLVNYQPPGDGESIGRFSKRIMKIYERILSEQKDNDIVIVAHGAVNRVILCEALGLDIVHMFNIQQDYGCLNIIDYFTDSRVVRLVNG
ncbi:MAG: histidine phosphatase family protein [Desulfatiglandaceae bacterium]